LLKESSMPRTDRKLADCPERPARGAWSWSPGYVAGALAAASLVFASACLSDDNDPNSGITAGQASGKFCHDLNRGGADVALTLELGLPTLARFTAVTGQCSPPLGTACTAIPVGAVPTRLLEGETVLASGTLYPVNGGSYIFRAYISTHPTVTQIALSPELSCQATSFVFDDGGVGGVSVPDGGALDGGGDTAAPTDAQGPATDAADAGVVDAPAEEAGVDAPAAEGGIDAAAADAAADGETPDAPAPQGSPTDGASAD
jgi:hypothetical protein